MQTFGSLNACCLAVSTRGLSSLCREDSRNRGDTRQTSIISELWTSQIYTVVIHFQIKLNWHVCCLCIVCSIPVLSGSVSTLLCFTPGGDNRRDTRSRCFLSGWYVICKLLHSADLRAQVYQILTDNSPLSGNSTRGALPLAESLDSLEATDRAADWRRGETEGFRQPVHAETSSQDHDTVEGQQHWDTRQVKWT